MTEYTAKNGSMARISQSENRTGECVVTFSFVNGNVQAITVGSLEVAEKMITNMLGEDVEKAPPNTE